MIPAELETADAPTCCPQLFDAADKLLVWLWDQIKACVGDGGPCGGMQRYVSWGPPIIRPQAPNVLAVYATSVGLQGSAPVWTYPANLVVELWEGCYPVPGDDGNGPEYATWHKANQHAYAHGLAMFNALVVGSMNGALVTALESVSCQKITPGALVPANLESGVAVGWRVPVTIVIG